MHEGGHNSSSAPGAELEAARFIATMKAQNTSQTGKPVPPNGKAAWFASIVMHMRKSFDVLAGELGKAGTSPWLGYYPWMTCGVNHNL